MPITPSPQSGELQKPAPQPDAPSLEDRLSKMEKATIESKKEGTMLQSLLADPEVRAVVAAKQKGEVVRVQTGREPEIPRNPNPPTEDDHKVDPDELDNRGLIDYMSKMLATTQSNTLSETLKPIVERLDQLDGYRKEAVKSDVNQQIEAAREKFRDFDEFLEPMGEIYNQYPNMSVEEIYTLAKVRAGSPITPNTSVESERPSSQTNRPTLQEQRETALPSGGKGWAQLLEEANKSRQEKRNKIFES